MYSYGTLVKPHLTTQQQMVTFYIDDHLFEYNEMKPEDVLVPSFDNVLLSHISNCQAMHTIKKPRCFSLAHKKINNIKYYYRFESKSKPDKKIKTGSVKYENVNRQSKYSNLYFDSKTTNFFFMRSLLKGLSTSWNLTSINLSQSWMMVTRSWTSLLLRQ